MIDILRFYSALRGGNSRIPADPAAQLKKEADVTKKRGMGISVRHVLVQVWLALLIVGSGVQVRAAGTDPAAAADAVRPSLAYIVVNGGLSGSGIVVSAGPDRAYVVTAAHVFARSVNRIKVIVGDDASIELRGTLIASNAASDVALVAIPAQPRLHAVTFGSPPPPGVALSALGYDAAARSRLEAGEGLRAMTARGTVGRMLANGRVAMSLRSDPGMSGGPVFDATAKVVGLIEGRTMSSRTTYEFTPALAVTKLLVEQHVPYTADFTRANDMALDDTVRALVPLANAPTAGRIALAVSVAGKVEDAKKNQQSLEPLASAARGAGTAFFSEYLHARTLPASWYGDQVDGFASTIRSQEAIGGVLLRLDVRANTALLGSGMHVSVRAILMDSTGTIWSIGASQAEKNRYFAFSNEELASAIAQLTTEALVDLGARMGDPSVAENFARYGIPLGTGQRSAFVWIAKNGDTATVTRIISRGSAARAGLQQHDVIVAINGRAVSAWEQTQIDEILKGAGRVDATVRGADGRDVVVSFRPNDIRQYLQMPAPKTR